MFKIVNFLIVRMNTLLEILKSVKNEKLNERVSTLPI